MKGLIIVSDFNYKGVVFNNIFVTVQPILLRNQNVIAVSVNYYFSKTAFTTNENNYLEVRDCTVIENAMIAYDRDIQGVDILALSLANVKTQLVALGYSNVTNELD